MPDAPVALSVVVATLDRPDLLALCLEALSPSVQTAVEPYEVIVVDQSARSPAGQTLEARFPFAVFHRVPPRGLSVARNGGAALARAEIVAFLDDDAIADRRWASAMIAAFGGPDREWAAACGGRVVADYGAARRPPWLTPALERFLSCVDFGETAGPLAASQWVVGANLAVRRRVLLAFGGFDAGLGRRGGGDLLSNEESALVERMGREAVLYEPAASVRHLIPSERLTQAWFRRRIAWQAVSDVLGRAEFLALRQAHRASLETSASPPAADLFSDAPDADTLETSLLALYDTVADALLAGRTTGALGRWA